MDTIPPLSKPLNEISMPSSIRKKEKRKIARISHTPQMTQIKPTARFEKFPSPILPSVIPTTSSAAAVAVPHHLHSAYSETTT